MKIGGWNLGRPCSRIRRPRAFSERHSEERRDEESAFSAVRGPRSSVVSKQIPHGVYPEQRRRIQDDSPAVRGKDPIFIRYAISEDRYSGARHPLPIPRVREARSEGQGMPDLLDMALG